MRSQFRRLKKIEATRFDVTGLVPRSEAWYEFYWDKIGRVMEGEKLEMKIPLEAFDEMMRRGELAEEERKAADPEGYAAEKLAEQRERELESRDEWRTVSPSMRDHLDPILFT